MQEIIRKFEKRYNYMVLQRGSLPLKPDHEIDRSIEHRCSSALIWPEHSRPDTHNTILTDPCFTVTGYKQAEKKLTKLGISFEDIGYLFITHRHGDHRPNFLCKKKFSLFKSGITEALSDFETLDCPGHSPQSRVLIFRSMLNDTVCIAGDTVLDLRWLKAWMYYWPNRYLPPEIEQTWDSVAKIISVADMIIPGHGNQIHVTARLVKELLSAFPLAECADKCQHVENILQKREEQLVFAEMQKHVKKPRKNK